MQRVSAGHARLLLHGWILPAAADRRSVQVIDFYQVCIDENTGQWQIYYCGTIYQWIGRCCKLPFQSEPGGDPENG